MPPVRVDEKEQVIGADRAHKEHQSRAASEAAKALAKLVSRQVNELVASADEAGKTERKVRLIPPPVMPQGGTTPGTAVSQSAR